MAEASAMPVYNFCSGPAMLPAPVLTQVQNELLSYQGCGISVMEMSHRSQEFLSILSSAERNLRQLMSIPNHYAVLFTQGGASLQFSAVPLNLLSRFGRAGFVDTGYWSQKAMEEASRYGEVVCVASAQEDGFKSVLKPSDMVVPENIDYLHVTPNETIGGLAFDDLPLTDVPIVADMSSCILSNVIDVSRYGLIYAGAQKNIGPAGLAVVIIRKDLLGKALQSTPRLLNYETLLENGSMANTPPTFAIYLANLVFEWLIAKGGLGAIEQINIDKAASLYSAIDASTLIYNDIDGRFRSKMNIPFFFHDERLTSLFIEQAEQYGLHNLKGHRSSGGCRASIYNAMPVKGVEKLIEFIRVFESKYA